jgi:putative transposase
MPWKETDAMKERVRLALEWERRWQEARGHVNMSELCREFGVSRDIGYKWINRYRKAGHDVRALDEQSRRPHHSPTAFDEMTIELVVRARKEHPKWGPRKLRAWLVERYPERPIPSDSTIAAILQRRGLARVTRRRRRRVADPRVVLPFVSCDTPNRVWCVDFKGWFRTRDGEKCYPLTITDAYSRYVLRCEGMLDPDGTGVFSVFDSAFREFGLPETIRSDNGPPFASTGAAGLSRLSVWWLQLGIRLERIAPGEPQQNGRHERMHRTLKAETEPQQDLRRQQPVFDFWRREFNDERPHEALAMRTPSKIYVPSSRSYPRPLLHPDAEHAPWRNVVQVDKNGCIVFAKKKVFVSSAIRHLHVELERHDEKRWDVYWGPILLGRIDIGALHRAMTPTRRRRGQVTVLTLTAPRHDEEEAAA